VCIVDLIGRLAVDGKWVRAASSPTARAGSVFPL
jgi:hypothetical protein